jgi:nucleoside-diphosphate-sugar epimerase
MRASRTRAPLARWARTTCSDPRRAADDLDFTPDVSLDEGLARQAQWSMAQTSDQRGRVAA